MKGSKLFLGVGAVVVGIGATVLMMPSEQNSNQPVSQPVESAGSETSEPVQANTQAVAAVSAPEEAVNDVAALEPAEIPLPEPAPALPEVDPNEVSSMWKASEQEQTVDENGIPATHLQVNPQLISSLQLGQTLEFEVPALNQSYQAELTTTHNQLDDVHVFKGKINNGSENDNVIVTRGEVETYVTVSTSDGVYSVRIDNASGKATMISEDDIAKTITNFNDAIPAPEVPVEPPKDRG
ncbi:hypothetical protein H0A36_11385 [Endozoicomonas sp. SM1973]|uniref:Uncharacterized protein n=1 Tax=Spartinivicinus marinus TaxID=2994442 RepID=A0A853I4X1_9GAMM|nr:hypothetical protein [Spartinivicinus marinus]MCX4026129.1 hypothetical protein [Spartinivicinus marinus]NYZ66612.1 hypothetical protein [Spartinivicinus marinus]